MVDLKDWQRYLKMYSNDSKDTLDGNSSDEVIYPSEYGASVPAWVSLDAGRWWRRRGAMGLSLLWAIIWSLCAQHVEAATFTHVNATVQRLQPALKGLRVRKWARWKC